jgi:8-oxo-dGTP pyrophosphatase MutT (NUDIX family)
MADYSTILLTDAGGRVLLQERDAYAPIAPNKWGMVGGNVEPGETFEAAAYRELCEETGLAWTSGLRLWRNDEFRYSHATTANRYQIWTAQTELSDADITVGEGRQIVFVAPPRISRLDLSESAAFFVPQFVGWLSQARGASEGDAQR